MTDGDGPQADTPPQETDRGTADRVPLRTVDHEAESIQQSGLDGKFAAKRYLESTTQIAVPFDSNNHGFQCTLKMLDGSHKRYDLRGYFFGTKNEVYAEVKNAHTAGDQSQEYSKFLAQAYSATAVQWQTLSDPKYEFFWITWHPFGTLANWSQLQSPSQINEALDKHPQYLNGQSADPLIVQTVADRLWLLVLHGRQSDLMPTDKEIRKILEKLGRS